MINEMNKVVKSRRGWANKKPLLAKYRQRQGEYHGSQGVDAIGLNIGQLGK